jgi:uncharacterized protein YndB with AHSA1/START domain
VTDVQPASAIVRRVLPAPPEVVFDEWLNQEALAEFMAPLPARAAQVEIEPRVGGRFRILMVEEDAEIQLTGEYIELDRPRRLKFSWRSDHHGGFDSIVTVSLEAHGSGETLMTIDHTLPPELVADHRHGWGLIAERLALRLSERAR